MLSKGKISKLKINKVFNVTGLHKYTNYDSLHPNRIHMDDS